MVRSVWPVVVPSIPPLRQLPEFGFHIIQLIEKRGEKVNVRHILRKPVVSDEAINKTLTRLDSIAGDLRAGKFTFEDAAPILSDDKDTRNSKGLMSTNMMQTGHTSSRFRMQDSLPRLPKPWIPFR